MAAPMRVGIVGTAFGESRCKMVHDVPEARLVAVCGRDRGRTQALADRSGCEAETDYRALIERPDIDVVGVYTSTDLHGEIAIAAAQAGKHVIVSKPTAVTLDEGKAMLAATRASGVRLVVEFDTRYMPGAYKVFKAIRDGRMGAVIQGEYANKCFRPQGYYDEGNGWRGNAELGGGCLLNQGVHPVDHLLWYQGPVEGVFAVTATRGHDIPAEDVASAVIRFRDGSQASMTVTTTFPSGLPHGRYGPGTLKRAQVHGLSGTATLEGDAIKHWNVPDGAASSSVPDDPPLNVFQDLALSLADPGRVSHTLVADTLALHSVALTTALRYSAATGRYIEIESLA